MATFLANLTEGWSWLPVCLAAVVAVLGAVDLTVGTLRCAYLHGDLARRFISLEQRFAHGCSLEDDEHEELTRARLEIEVDEPPPLRLLDVMCHFELLRSLGDKERPPDIPWRRQELEEKGLKFVGHSTDGQRMEIMELKGMRADQASCYCVLQFIVNKFCFCNVSITLGNLQASVIGLLQNKICQLCCGSPRSINRFQSSFTSV